MTSTPAADSPPYAGAERAPGTARTSFGLRALTVSVVAFAVLTLWAVSIPGTYFLLLIFLPMFWAVLGIVWLVAGLRTIYRTGFRGTLVNRWLIGTVVVALLTAGAIAADVPLRVRFEASRAAMDAIGPRLAAAAAPQELPDQWIGLFDAERIERFEGGFRFLVKGSGFLDPVGFAYSPDRSPPNIGGEDRYEPFEGGWWIWTESW
jgi:hypothetical protein